VPTTNNLSPKSIQKYKLPLQVYNDFRGGWNADAAPDSIADTEMAQADDLDLNSRGGMRRRQGYLRLNAVSYGAQVKQDIEYTKNNGTNQILSLIGSNLCRMNQDDWTIDSVICDMTRDTVPHYFYGDKMLFTDGTDYKVYDGSALHPVQLAKPATVPTVTGSNYKSDGIFNGTYQCWVTFVQADGFESDPSTVVTVTVGINKTIGNFYNMYYSTLSWSNIPIGPIGTVSRKLYRTKAGEDEGRLLTTIEDNTTTTFADSVIEDDLSVISYLIDDNDLTKVKSCEFMVYHKKSGRVFTACSTSADVQYSEQERPEYFRAYVTPTSGDGPVIGLSIFGDALVVHYLNGAWVWRGQDPEEDAIWQKLPMPGAFSHWGIVDTPGSLTWIGPGGLFSVAPGILAYGDVHITTAVTNFAEKKVQSVIANMGTHSVISAVYDAMNSRVYIAYPNGTSSTANTHILVLDWTLKAFTRYTNINAVHLLQRKNGDILAATNGYIVKLNGAVNDPDNKPVTMAFRSKPYSLGYPFHKKRILRLFTEFKSPENGEVELSFNIYVDSILVYSRNHASLGGDFIWGQSNWGEAIWGQRELMATRSKISQSGHRVEVEVVCDQLDIEDVIVYGFAFEFRPIRAKGERI
jgi:hypothetical protein